MWKANVSEHGPVLDWDRAYGPKVMLYNLCDDPTEKHNLAFLEEGKEGGRKGGREVVERMYGEMMGIVREAPVQFAGDTLVTLPGERERRKREKKITLERGRRGPLVKRGRRRVREGIVWAKRRVSGFGPARTIQRGGTTRSGGACGGSPPVSS